MSNDIETARELIRAGIIITNLLAQRGIDIARVVQMQQQAKAEGREGLSDADVDLLMSDWEVELNK